MRKALTSIAAGLLVLLSQLVAQSKPAAKQEPPPKIKVGDTAPDFTLLAFDGNLVKPVSLHDFHGKKNVALAFYVFAFTGG